MKLQKKSLKLISLILIIIIEAAISIYTLTGLLRTRETVVFQPDMLDEDNATPYFTLDQGIYTVSVGYEDGGGGDLLLSRSVAEPMPEENTIFSDETKFRPGEDRIAYELYVRFNGTSLRINNNLSEKSGELSLREISLTYLKKRSISYFSLRLLLLWLIIDLLLYCILFKPAGFLAFIRKHRFSILLGAAAIFIAVFPVLQPMLQEGDDFDFHLQRLSALSDSLRHGIFPAKIQSGWLGGSGYAAGALYGDLLMYPAAMLNILGFPLGSCYRAYLIAMTVLCYIIGLFSFGKISGDEKLGAISSAFYTLSLYRLIDVHVRSAMGEYSALSFIPLIILGLHLIYAEKKKGWHYIAWGAFGVVETHLLSSVILIEFIVLFCLIRFKDTFKKETLLELLKAAAASIAVNAFYIAPFLDIYFGENLNGMNGDGVLRSMENNAVYLNSLFIPIDSSDHFVWISLGEGYGVLLLLMLFSLLNGWWERLGPDGRAALVL
ncbi:MAG: hypothetical protein J6O55_01080, partial [Lachnospiraceae bacterium]|nr:hypothetical protein [Lachnospiraceae bacterium]